MQRLSSVLVPFANQMTGRLARFCVVGASGVAVNMGVLITLTEVLGIPYAVSSIVAIELSILSNFALNNIWTWSDRRMAPLGQRLIKYHLVAGTTALIANWCLLVFLTTVAGFDYRIANLVGIAVGIILNFVFNHLWTFRRRADPNPLVSSNSPSSRRKQ